MNQRRRQMESSIFDKQRSIQTKSNVLWTMKFTEKFQRMMNSNFRDLSHKEVLVNYMDDFVISTKTRKYDFNMEEILILGVEVR